MRRTSKPEGQEGSTCEAHKKGLCSIINKTSRVCLPDPEELEQLQILLMEESELIKESLKKLESLNEIVLKTGMNQMVMNLKEAE